MSVISPRARQASVPTASGDAEEVESRQFRRGSVGWRCEGDRTIEQSGEASLPSSSAPTSTPSESPCTGFLVFFASTLLLLMQSSVLHRPVESAVQKRTCPQGI